MKEVIGKPKHVHSTLPRKTVVNKNVIFEEKHIANAFNNFSLTLVQNQPMIFQRLHVQRLHVQRLCPKH